MQISIAVQPVEYFWVVQEVKEHKETEGSINANISFSDCLELSYDSIKSILTACAATTNTNSKTVAFNKTIADQNNELINLVTQCTEKGWQVTGLNITTE